MGGRTCDLVVLVYFPSQIIRLLCSLAIPNCSFLICLQIKGMHDKCGVGFEPGSLRSVLAKWRHSSLDHCTCDCQDENRPIFFRPARTDRPQHLAGVERRGASHRPVGHRRQAHPAAVAATHARRTRREKHPQKYASVLFEGLKFQMC